MEGDSRYTIGLDLGQSRNHTAMAVMKRVWMPATASEFIASGSRGYQGEYRHTVVGADRLSLGTSYPRVVSWVKSVAAELGDELGAIVVDASGVGSAVMDLLRRAEMGVRLVGVVITGNQASAPPGHGRTAAGFETVSRTELLTKLQVAVQTGQFRVDRPRCREWEAMRRELSTLRLDGAGPARQQDDLAFALALAVWWGVKW
ncbi:MAG TPA: hypothetical protein VGL53_32335 [Bryobacteraceae bacterium]|jgi:hypothetical protein